MFSHWTGDAGVTFADPTSVSTTFVMPAKNVTVTAHWICIPEMPTDYILNATFDSLPLGAFGSNDEGLILEGGYAQNSTIVQPVSGDAFYKGPADRLLKVVAANNIFNTRSKEITNQFKIGEDYVFEMSFFATGKQTTPCLSFRYGQWAWEYDYFTLTDWHGGMVVYDHDGREIPITPEPNAWHRYAVKFRFETESKLAYSFYYDDMSKPVATGKRDAAEKYDNKNLIGNLGFTAGLWNVGVDMNKYPLYINNVLIYQGDIRS